MTKHTEKWLFTAKRNMKHPFTLVDTWRQSHYTVWLLSQCDAINEKTSILPAISPEFGDDFHLQQFVTDLLFFSNYLLCQIQIVRMNPLCASLIGPACWCPLIQFWPFFSTHSHSVSPDGLKTVQGEQWLDRHRHPCYAEQK